MLKVGDNLFPLRIIPSEKELNINMSEVFLKMVYHFHLTHYKLTSCGIDKRKVHREETGDINLGTSQLLTSHYFSTLKNSPILVCTE